MSFKTPNSISIFNIIINRYDILFSKYKKNLVYAGAKKIIYFLPLYFRLTSRFFNFITLILFVNSFLTVFKF